jgi:gliding motility-associated-like protein
LVYTYTVIGDAPCPNATATVTLNSVQFPSYTISQECRGLDFTLTVSPFDSNTTYNWYNSANELMGSGESIVVDENDTYELEVIVSSCSETQFITVNNAFCSIPKGLSPNGDTLNDTWNLSNLNVKKVQIFNRYGLELYSQNNYTNQWTGRSNAGDDLPSATYYYVLTFANGTVKTGWVYLNREN